MKHVSIISSYPRRGELHSDATAGVASYTKNLLHAWSAQSELAVTVWAEMFDGEREQVYRENKMIIRRMWRRDSIPSIWNMYKQIGTRRTDTIVVALDLHMIGGWFATLVFLWYLLLLKLNDKDVHIILHKVIAQWKGEQTNLLKRTLLKTYATLYYTLVLAASHNTVVFEDKLQELLQQVALQYRLRSVIERVAHAIGWVFVSARRIWAHLPRLGRAPGELTHVSARKVAGVKRATKRRIVRRIEDLIAWRPTPVHVIPHAVEDVILVEKGVSRAQLKLDDNAYYALCFGYLTPHKGLDEIIAMWPKAKSVRLILAGGALPHKSKSAQYRRYIRGLQARAKKAGIIITGFIPEKKIPLYFSACDVVVLPYRTFVASAGPLALAFAYEKPVLMSSALDGYFESRDFKKVLSNSSITKQELTFVFEHDNFQKSLKNILGNLRRSTDFSRSMKHMRSWKNIASQYNDLVK